MKRIAAVALLLCLIFTCAACFPVDKTLNGFSMGSFYSIDYAGSASFGEDVKSLLDEIERTYSATDDFSVISKINSAEDGDEILLSEAEGEVFSRIFSIVDGTNRTFDPSVYPLVCAWGFDPPFLYNNKTPPSEDAIARARNACAIYYFVLSEDHRSIIKLKEESKLDFGGAMKGYAASAVADLIKDKVESALVNVGGTVAAVNRDYSIGVECPRDSDEEYAFSFTLGSGEVCATSGDYENFYIYNGTRYHHIIDSFTGNPAKSGVISATVISEDGLLSDCLATAAVVAGVEDALRFFKAYGVKGALITEDKEVYAYGLTVNIKDTSYVLHSSEEDQ